MDLIKTIMETPINKNKVDQIQSHYADRFPEFIQKMLSFIDDVVFLDNSYRLLSFEEVLNAEDEMNVRFSDIGVLPLIDCGDNDFISFGTKDETWFVFNIVDEISFRKRESLSELL